MKANKLPVIIGAAAVTLILIMTLKHFNMIPGLKVHEAAVPTAFELMNEVEEVALDTSVTAAAIPSTKAATINGPAIRLQQWAWNAHMGLHFANGGPSTTKGSLMEKNKVKLQIVRQDDTGISTTALMEFAEALYKGEAEPAKGIHFTTIMGDQAAAFLAGTEKLTSKLGPEYRAEIIGIAGFSVGEDGFWGPEAWQTCDGLRGALISGVLREGDWNIAVYKAQQCDIPNNANDGTYDANAINWIAAPDYLKAVEMWVLGSCYDLDEIAGSKRTGKKVHKCLGGHVTWTPGDVNSAKKRGGLVRILSTKENPYQMPAVIIGIHKWDMEHKDKVENFLDAIFKGSDQIKRFPEALQAASKVSHAIYKEETPAYWAKYFRGVVEKDKRGVSVPLGGTKVANLADNLLMFGLLEGSGGVESSVYNAAYTGFGNIVKQQYPKLVPSFPPVSEAVNLTFIQDLAAKGELGGKADTQTFESGTIAEENIQAKKNWNISFDTGSAKPTVAGVSTLNDLYNQLVIGAGFAVDIQGHTDNVGEPDSNQKLSVARADAVKQYLQQKSSVLFPEERTSASGFGDRKPVADNATAEGRAKNRRVTIILGTK